jgi:hypothetical protein
MVPCLLLLNPHIRKMFHSHLLLVLKNLHPHTHKIHQRLFHPHLLLLLVILKK